MGRKGISENSWLMLLDNVSSSKPNNRMSISVKSSRLPNGWISIFHYIENLVQYKKLTLDLRIKIS
jgi:hypothetical protein